MRRSCPISISTANGRRCCRKRRIVRSVRDDRPYEINYKGLGRTFPHRYGGGLDKPVAEFYAFLPWRPPGDEILLDFAKTTIEGEGLGKRPDGVPDVFAVSLSAQDYMNHVFGPERPGYQGLANVCLQATRLPCIFALMRSTLVGYSVPDVKSQGVAGPLVLSCNSERYDPCVLACHCGHIH